MTSEESLKILSRLNQFAVPLSPNLAVMLFGLWFDSGLIVADLMRSFRSMIGPIC